MQVPFLNWSTFHSRFKKAWLQDIGKIYDSGLFLRGPYTARFEEQFASYCSSSDTKLHAVGVSNGLDALTLILKAYDFECGSEVMIPGNTFIATALAVVNAGYKPVLVPPDRETYTLDTKRLDEFFSERTRAVVPVHLYGRTCNMSEISIWAKQKGIPVIEDAAQAHGALFREKKAGSFGAAAAFSFYPGKNLGALGDAGAVVTSDHELAEKIRCLSNYGSARKYEHEFQGQNARMDEVQASFLVHKLAYLDSQLELRRKISKVYISELPDEIHLPPEDDEQYSSAWHLFVIRHGHRDKLQQFLVSRGIECLVHYPCSIDQHNAFKHCGLNPCNTSRNLSEEILSLPIGPHVGSSQLEYIIRQVREFFGT